jgi:hypothetical protein
MFALNQSFEASYIRVANKRNINNEAQQCIYFLKYYRKLLSGKTPSSDPRMFTRGDFTEAIPCPIKWSS